MQQPIDHSVAAERESKLLISVAAGLGCVLVLCAGHRRRGGVSGLDLDAARPAWARRQQRSARALCSGHPDGVTIMTTSQPALRVDHPDRPAPCCWPGAGQPRRPRVAASGIASSRAIPGPSWPNAQGCRWQRSRPPTPLPPVIRRVGSWLARRCVCQQGPRFSPTAAEPPSGPAVLPGDGAARRFVGCAGRAATASTWPRCRPPIPRPCAPARCCAPATAF